MHPSALSSWLNALNWSFNSLYLGFFHAPFQGKQHEVDRFFPFQFPLLGIFPCTPDHWVCGPKDIAFQFPLLGIFPCTDGVFRNLNIVANFLSIPFTWDFSMHHHPGSIRPCTWSLLSIPFTWDFSMHLCFLTIDDIVDSSSFNSLYLGFFHAPYLHKLHRCGCEVIFQFPLLGIFPCTDECCHRRIVKRSNFQFPLLGIFPCTSLD